MGLEWSLPDSPFYPANVELETTLEITAPEAGVYYLLGALYTRDGSYMPGTIFGITVPEGSEFGVVNVTETKIWDLAVGESASLPCKLVIGRTGVILGLFLVRMVGEAASLEHDVAVAQVSAALNAPTAPIEAVVLAIPAMLLVVGLGMIMSKEGLQD